MYLTRNSQCRDLRGPKIASISEFIYLRYRKEGQLYFLQVDFDWKTPEAPATLKFRSIEEKVAGVDSGFRAKWERRRRLFALSIQNCTDLSS